MEAEDIWGADTAGTLAPGTEVLDVMRVVFTGFPPLPKNKRKNSHQKRKPKIYSQYHRQKVSGHATKIANQTIAKLSQRNKLFDFKRSLNNKLSCKKN